MYYAQTFIFLNQGDAVKLKRIVSNFENDQGLINRKLVSVYYVILLMIRTMNAVSRDS